MASMDKNLAHSSGAGVRIQYSRKNPAKAGETVSYDSMDIDVFAFKLEATVLEIVRSGTALKMAIKADRGNVLPPEDKEYLLVKFKVNVLQSRDDAPLDFLHRLGIVRSDGSMYEQNSFVSIWGLKTLQPMYEGSIQEGYACFTVDKDDENILIVFPTSIHSQIWFSGTRTTNSEDDFNPLGDPNRLGTKNNPAGLGEKVSYMGADFPRASYYVAYNTDITMTELNRGQRAMDMAIIANKHNETPPAGKEYIITKIKVDAIESRNSGMIEFENNDFHLFSSKGIEYKDKAHINDLRGYGLSKMSVGSSQEGYFTFVVDQDDEAPFLVFSPIPENSVWISAKESDKEPLVDPNPLGSRRKPVPLGQSIVCDIKCRDIVNKIEITIVDYTRGILSKHEQNELGINFYDFGSGMELLVIRVELVAHESKANSRIDICNSNFELVNGGGVKYEKINTYSNIPRLQDMYPGATQRGFIIFSIKKTDRQPLILFNETYSDPGTWFSLTRE